MGLGIEWLPVQLFLITYYSKSHERNKTLALLKYKQLVNKLHGVSITMIERTVCFLYIGTSGVKIKIVALYNKTFAS